MRVDERPEHAAEPRVDRGAHAALRLELFLDALENEHVRVHTDPHGEHEARDARQRHHGADIRHQPEQDDEVEDERHDRVHTGQPVVDEHEADDEQQADDRREDARADRIGSQARPDRALLQICERRRQRARPQDERQVLHFFLGEAAGDAAVRGDARVDPRRRLHAAVENDGELPADVLAGDLAELASAFRVEREADGRLIVFVERRPGIAQIAAGHRRRFSHQVVHGAGRFACSAGRARDDFHAGRHLPVLLQSFRGRGRPLFDDFQLEQPGRPDNLLRALDVGDARQLNQNLVAALTLLRDVGLGDAELVHATLDGLSRLHHRVVAKVDHDVGLHRERVSTVGARAAIEVGLDFDGGLSERGVLGRRHPLDTEMGRVG